MEKMSNNVLLAVIEACGEALINRKAHEEKMMEYINFQDEQREIMCKRIGELEGRDDEKIKKECEEIEKGSDPVVCDKPCGDSNEKTHTPWGICKCDTAEQTDRSCIAGEGECFVLGDGANPTTSEDCGCTPDGADG